MSEGIVRKWIRMFNKGRENVHDEEHCGHQRISALSPYCLDLSPSDFHLFSHLKKFLAGQKFASDDEIKVNVQDWFMLQAVEFYEAGILQLVPRYDTCLNSHGEYVEK